MKSDRQATVPGPAATTESAPRKNPLFGAALFFAIVLAALFYPSFDSQQVHFSNDGPLGGMVAEHNRMPKILTGVWEDLNWLGNQGLSPSPSITTLLRLVTTPRVYARILPPASLFIVGICAVYYFRRLKLTLLACVLGGLAAALNSDFLSTSCWGVASQIVGFGACYVALGLLTGNDAPRRQWVRVMLAGMAVGLAIMEAYDIGAIFSLFIAAYVLYGALFSDGGSAGQKLGTGLLRIAVVAGFAAFIATHTLNMLVGTQLKGIVSARQDAETRQHHWAEATQWSLPKLETLQVIIPGIFGYRLDSAAGDNYWGSIGESPALPAAVQAYHNPASTDADRAQAAALLTNPSNWRITGTGFYAGVSVVLIALWAALQAFRKAGSPFSLPQRRAVRFWTGVVVICLLMAFGKYAPLFQIWYALPYASVIRNPTKFMHVFNWALVILFTYGVDGMARAYMQQGIDAAAGSAAKFKTLAAPFDRKFLFGCVGALMVALIGWSVYKSSSVQVQKYIESVGIDPVIAPRDVKYSLFAVGCFVVLLTANVVWLALLFCRKFVGARARIGGIWLGVLIAADLGSADTHWIHYWNVPYKYATNPVTDLLRDKPWEHRVDMCPLGSQSPTLNLFRQLYDIEWHQQLFQYYDIQSLKVVMEPRVTEDKDRFLTALPWSDSFNIDRTWELSNTRFLLGNGGENFVNALNQRFDPVKRRFRVAKFPNGDPAQFSMVYKPTYDTNRWLTLEDYTAIPDINGELGVVEFTGALPRAKLFSNWQVSTNDNATLGLLASPNFDPHEVVLVSGSNAPAPKAAGTNQTAGTVEITQYQSKRIELSADAKASSVLLLSERYNPNWHVEVDGKPAPLLRCDFILRGVYLEAGKHHVVLRFVLPQTTLYISLAAIVLGLVLCGWLAVTREQNEVVVESAPIPSSSKAANTKSK